MMSGGGSNVGMVGGIGIVRRLEFVRKFWRGVRGCGKVKVCAKTGFVSNKGWWGGKRMAKRETAASRKRLESLSFFARRSNERCTASNVLRATGRRWGGLTLPNSNIWSPLFLNTPHSEARKKF